MKKPRKGTIKKMAKKVMRNSLTKDVINQEKKIVKRLIGKVAKRVRDKIKTN